MGKRGAAASGRFTLLNALILLATLILLTALILLAMVISACGGDVVTPRLVSSEPLLEVVDTMDDWPKIVPRRSGGTSSLRGVAISSDHSVWISGSGGALLRSSDEGESWLEVPIPGAEELDFRDIQVLEPETVLVMSAGPGGKSRIYKTSDNGQTWRLVYENIEESAFFNGFAFWDQQRGVLTSDSTDGRLYLLATDDGGETWTRLDGGGMPALVEGEYGFAASGTGIAALADSQLWVATGGSAARVFHSTDSGVSWEVQETPISSGTPSSGIFSLAFRDELRGVAVGGDYQAPEVDGGNVAWTSDGGGSWTPAEAPNGMPHKACVRFLGAGRYLAVGRTGLAYSVDDGHHWSHIANTAFYAMDFDLTRGIGWVVGPEGAVARVEMEPELPSTAPMG